MKIDSHGAARRTDKQDPDMLDILADESLDRVACRFGAPACGCNCGASEPGKGKGK